MPLVSFTDGLKHLKFMTGAFKVRFDMVIAKDQYWGEIRDDVVTWCNKKLSGDFKVMLGREGSDHFSETQCELVVLCSDKVDSEIVYEKWGGIITAPTPREASRPVPQWLLNLCK